MVLFMLEEKNGYFRQNYSKNDCYLEKERERMEEIKRKELEYEERRKNDKILYTKSKIKHAKQLIEKEKQLYKELTGIDYNENSD